MSFSHQGKLDTGGEGAEVRGGEWGSGGGANCVTKAQFLLSITYP